MARIASSTNQSSPQFRFEKDHQLLLVVFSEPFSVSAIDQAEQTVASGQWAGYSRLFDFSHCALSPTTTELLEAGKQVNAWKDSGEVRRAWVAASQKDVGLLRIIVGQNSEQSVRVFLSDTEARRWLVGDNKDALESPVVVDHVPLRLRGRYSLSEVSRQQQAYRQQPDFDKTMPILWDLRDSMITESLNDVQTLAVDLAQRHTEDRAGFRSAVLVDSHLMDLLIREMTKVDGWPGDDIAVFRSYREALGWLSTARDDS